MKKFLQKAFAMLVLCLFSMSAMAQDKVVVFDFNRTFYSYTGSGTGTLASGTDFETGWVFTVEGATFTFDNAVSSWYNNAQRLRLGAGTSFTVTAPEGYEITSILFNTDSDTMTFADKSGLTGTTTSKTWTGNSESESFTVSANSWIQTITLNLAVLASDPITYTVDFVNAPAGAAATIDGNVYTGDDQFTVEKKLFLSAITDVVEPIGYSAETSYNEGTHTFTITYVAIPSIKAGTTWTTMTLDTAFSLGDGYTPYIVTGVTDGVLTLEEVQGGAPEKSGVYLNQSDIQADGYTIRKGDNQPYIESGAALLDFGEIYSSTTDFYVTFHAPEGGVITKISPNYDGKYGYITWSNGDLNGNWEGSAAQVTANLWTSQSALWIFGFEIEYEVPGATIIPANEGILVNGPTNTNIPYTLKGGSATSDVTGNLLVGCTADATWNEAGKTYYKFSLNAANEEGSEGFYWGVDGGASIEAHAGKAYLVLDGAAPSNRFLINGFDEETTGIEAIATESNDAIFNLQGQRVNATAAGIYVKNGKKFIVK